MQTDVPAKNAHSGYITILVIFDSTNNYQLFYTRRHTCHKNLLEIKCTVHIIHMNELWDSMMQVLCHRWQK